MRLLVLAALVLCAHAASVSAGGAKPPPPTKPPTKPPPKVTTKPPVKPPSCPPNEVPSDFAAIECQSTCSNPYLSENKCPWKPGCICKPGLLRDSKGRCVEPEDCDICKPKEKYSKCGCNDCQNTCDKPDASKGECPCKPGCICADPNMVRNSKGDCVAMEECYGCKPNEKYSKCGSNDCQNTCVNPDASSGECPCTPGCVCADPDMVRNTKGDCVPIEECDTCKENEKYSKCGNNDCQDTCENPKASQGTCPCKPGCICVDGYYKNTKGVCVPIDQCDVCKEQEVFSKCGNNECQNTCELPDKSNGCNGPCEPGCICSEGNIRDKNGVCIPKTDCEPVCKEGEEYSKCDNYPCRRTCEDPNGPPGCNPSPDCYPGCICKPGTLRNKDGACVPENQCAYNCPGPNEEFQFCGTACPKTCDNKDKDIICTLQCVMGCFCQNGYVRDKNNKCILPEDCPPPPCGPNEIYDKCPPSSPAECDCTNVFKGTKPSHPNPCKPGCKCKSPYVRVGKNCVAEEKCCTDPNAELVKNPPCCGGGTCAKPDWITGCGKKPDAKGCQCKKGYCKKTETDATCIIVKDCKKVK